MPVHRQPSSTTRSRTHTDEVDLTPTELLDIFGDEYTRRVFEAIADTPQSGRDVAETIDVSRPTAYRRLNKLQDAGLVTTETVLAKKGRHHKQYKAVVDELRVSFNDDGSMDVSVQTTN
ncbi:winged helix-turn-helix domain-containing protein [Halobacterium sp. KA-4]|uniref:winged helix-turn-helix domain-containing protein n=1 Tax=Halobacterium sp. KA-4 TaxID=2896367 RepID=UPI001E3844C2|nr:winged helix-turn-helix domain-containing protein [Halobacterium sp. KA-4]MCD2200432.1 winged helix-turn-helix domain-containing protein [Halobacterium sp. KA-4]